MPSQDDLNGSGAGPAKPYIWSHTGLRGIAALAVFAYHLQLEKAYRLQAHWAEPIIMRGYLWVDLFFMLSGFVLSMKYQERFVDGVAAPTRAFLVARVSRILPLHLFALWYLFAVEAGLNALSAIRHSSPYWGIPEESHYSNLALQAALIQIWDRAATLDWNIPSWSISAEMHVYLLFPILAIALNRLPRLTAATLAVIAIVSYAVCVSQFATLDILTPLALTRCLAGFALGVLLQTQRQRMEQVPRSIASAMQGVAVVAIVGVLLLPVHDVWVIAPFALLVLSTAADRGVIAEGLAKPWLHHIGERSYSIYLLNFPVIVTASIVWPKIAPAFVALPSDLVKLAWMSFLAGVILVLSNATYRVIEKPAGRWVLGRLSTNRAN